MFLLASGRASHAELLLVYAPVPAHGTPLAVADIVRMVLELASAAMRQMIARIAVNEAVSGDGRSAGVRALLSLQSQNAQKSPMGRDGRCFNGAGVHHGT
ncbi:hypothetical protein [Paraburkholderia sp. BL10I2N1]|uniref:hypothetical protein n=1 Tax=Paraburkholderia sp. BL10I2N1 TaxID=1938796 RepID=UPI001061EE44|nr:hypothetical protein [Paraburkholderia sp. BL10I2N1]